MTEDATEANGTVAATAAGAAGASVAVATSVPAPTRKRRNYSREGCNQCKQKKIKCDEIKPICGACRSSNRLCTYEKTLKFNNSRIFTVNENGKNINLSRKAATATTAVLGPRSPKKTTTAATTTTTSITTAAADAAPTAPPPTAAVPPALFPSQYDSSLYLKDAIDPIPFDTQLYPSLYNELFHDASSLISDLNDLINSDSPLMFGNNSNSGNSGNNLDEVSIGPGSRSNSNTSYTNANTNTNGNNGATDFQFNTTDAEDLLIHDPVIPKQQPNTRQDLNDFKLLTVLENSITQADLINIANYFELSVSSSHVNYLKTFATKVHLNLMPFSTAYLHNAFINNVFFQAKKSPYLLSAILAISARYEYYQLAKTNKNTNLKIHKKLRAFYLSSCLNSLDSVLRKKKEAVNNIESLLFTTLILACDFSSSTGSNWRAHLRGAKDLLLKYSAYTNNNNVSLLLSKTIFSSMEMLASMTVSIGGTIHNTKELDELLNLKDMDFGKYLSYYGLALDANYDNEEEEGGGGGEYEKMRHSYNMYFGHSIQMTKAIREIIISLEAIRRAKTKRYQNENSSSTTMFTTGDDQKDSLKFKAMIDIVDGKVQLCSQQILKVFSALHHASNVFVITKKGPFLIEPSSKYHPTNALLHPEDRVPVSCYFFRESDEQWFSWYDLCNQAYVDAATLRFMLADKVLAIRYSMASAQQLVRKIIENLFFIELKQFSDTDTKKLEMYYQTLDSHDRSVIKSLLGSRYQSEDEHNGKEDAAPALHNGKRSVDDDDDDDDDDDSNRLKIVNETEDESSSDDDHTAKKRKVIKTNSHQASAGVTTTKTRPKTSIYLNAQLDHRIIMIQWPLLICGICAKRAIDKLIIEVCFEKMISYGIGSAEMSLNKVKKNWLVQEYFHQRGDTVDATESLFWDDGDSVPFS